mmetsp:Transcript_26921/g.57250  ORF Transcript_26921/g.57250 Transcript_26921/m.57250 type:complete len:202 (+) Transcript_26921:1869-2474(+)
MVSTERRQVPRDWRERESFLREIRFEKRVAGLCRDGVQANIQTLREAPGLVVAAHSRGPHAQAAQAGREVLRGQEGQQPVLRAMPGRDRGGGTIEGGATQAGEGGEEEQGREEDEPPGTDEEEGRGEQEEEGGGREEEEVEEIGARSSFPFFFRQRHALGLILRALAGGKHWNLDVLSDLGQGEAPHRRNFLLRPALFLAE